MLHTNCASDGPTSAVTPRPEILRLAGGDDLTVHMWVLTPELWKDLVPKRVSTDQRSTARQDLVLEEAGIEDPVVYENGVSALTP
ncbi:hypothetical protein [Streptomyces sp. NPDC046859]|uniref:hypothetical protein n=1 Tax=Streptomyces sp. NPDC046859 TaxID=3155734 RepID=UPI0034026286